MYQDPRIQRLKYILHFLHLAYAPTVMTQNESKGQNCDQTQHKPQRKRPKTLLPTS